MYSIFYIVCLKTRRRHQISFWNGCEPPRGCWELNSGPLKEQCSNCWAISPAPLMVSKNCQQQFNICLHKAFSKVLPLYFPQAAHSPRNLNIFHIFTYRLPLPGLYVSYSIICSEHTTCGKPLKDPCRLYLPNSACLPKPSVSSGYFVSC